jgi:hypothetical protein
VNDAPTATSQTVSLFEDTPINLILSGSDIEGDRLTFVVLTQPQHGTLSGTLPELRYIPASDFNGSDSFTFKVNDGELDSTPATVILSVAPVNDPPLVNAGPDRMINLTDTITQSGSVQDVDSPAESLTVIWSVVEGPGAIQISDARALAPQLTFSVAGIYVLRLTALDEPAEGSDEVVITVNGAPVVDAGPDQELLHPNSALLSGTVTDDGLPPRSAARQVKVTVIEANRPPVLAASSRRSHASTVGAMGFSSSTSLPARRAATATSACRWLGTTMSTASTSGRASNAR